MRPTTFSTRRLVVVDKISLPIYRVDHYLCGDRSLQVQTEIFDENGLPVLVTARQVIKMLVVVPTPKGNIQVEVDLTNLGTFDQLLHMDEDEFRTLVTARVHTALQEMQTKASLRLQK